MARAHRIPLFGFLLLVAACSSPTEAERLLDRVDRAEARWLAERPVSYEVVQRRICECLPSETGPVVLHVTVQQGSFVHPEPETIVSGTYVPTGGEVQPGDAVPADVLERFVTVTELFGLIRAAVEQGAHTVEAEFDAELGYPTEVDILPDPQIPDGGVGYRLQLVGN